tara:strand:- start:332 stop:595 length:264 start_codon:yes stop_codon:yes gene_type:complete
MRNYTEETIQHFLSKRHTAEGFKMFKLFIENLKNHYYAEGLDEYPEEHTELRDIHLACSVRDYEKVVRLWVKHIIVPCHADNAFDGG